MALFSRRFLQKALNASTGYFSEKQRRDHCKLLNTVHEHYLATEWEIAILNSLKDIGTVQYEPPMSGTSRPDILFKASEEITFVADIAAVSDRGLNRDNPFEALQEEFRRRQRKAGLGNGGFYTRVGSYPEKHYRGSGKKPRLKLPKISEFPKRIFNVKFQNFMDMVRASPEEEHHFQVEDEETSVHFSYNPSQRGFGGSTHLSYNLISVIDRNPIYNALAAKAAQLGKCGHEGMKGIILCDAGCWSLHQTSSNWEFYGLDEVVGHFLRQTRTVSFVIVLIVEDEQRDFARITDQTITHKLYANRHVSLPTASLERFSEQLVSGLPIPEQNPTNALLQVKRKDGMTGRHLGTLTHGGDIEMSARMLLEILAGNLTMEQFEQNYRMKSTENPFRIKLQQGFLINDLSFAQVPQKDDDRVTIHFGKKDPAVCPFSCDPES